MPLLETDYCIEQINVPPKLPMILKQFCKSAIRTQPYDLLKWSSAYFHALANGEEPPTKLRLEYPPSSSPYGLTLGFLKVLLRQLGADYNKVVRLETILKRWDYLCLDRRDADLIILIGKFRTKCQIKQFLSIGVGLLTCTLTETMIMVCELFTHEPDGGSAMIPLGLFMEIYGYLAGLRCDGADRRSMQDVCLCSDESSSVDAKQDVSEKKERQVTGPDSVASQETSTEAEIDLDLDSFMKDETHYGMTLQSFGEESERSFLHEGQASFLSESSFKSDTLQKKKEEMKTESSKESLGLKKDEATEPQQGSKQTSVTKEEGSTTSGPESSLKTNSSLLTYPDVPGIGRRLTAEEVASVAIWMSECARRQGGMVGPRNVRHLNCPPLEGCQCGK